MPTVTNLRVQYTLALQAIVHATSRDDKTG